MYMVTIPLYIIIVAVLLVLAIVTLLLCPFIYRVKDRQAVNAESQPLSVIITAHDSAQQLDRVLEGFLSQEYDADYQVVIVIDEGDSSSEDILKKYKDNPHLYYTKLPTSSRYLSRRKLAITIGMRAAKYNWCVLTSVNCLPKKDQWLRHFAKYICDESNLVLGMTPYEKSSPAYYRYDLLRTALYHFNSAQRGMAFSTNQPLIAMRKDEFFQRQGFAGNLEYQRAEYEHLVNKFATKERTMIAVAPEARLVLSKPTKKQWMYRHMHSIDSFKSMKRSFSFRLRYHVDLWAMHIYNLLTISAIVYGVWGVVMSRQMSLAHTVILSSAILLWILSFVIRCAIYAPVLRYFDNVHPIKAVIFDWFVSWYNLGTRIKYYATDKYDFMTHKL
jgi:glycosyltransferase involved in cell wall biosynthesis